MSTAPSAETVVIGAGAAGLWVAAELRRRGADVLVLDRAHALGASWRGRYQGLRLNTVRRLSGLPGHPIPRRCGRWPARDDFVAYLENVAERLRLPIRLGVGVSHIERAVDRWELETAAGRIEARCVVVATGYDRVPVLPAWPGRESFGGELIHSSEFRSPAPYRDRDVLVVGPGNSGSEIANHLVEGGAGRVEVAVRTPVNLVPREVLGVPITAFARLGERQPAWMGDAFGRLVQRFAWGDLAALGMPRAPYGISTELRVRGLGPVVDGGFVAALKARRIELVPAVERFEGPEVVLANGVRRRPDAVIAATGYRHGLEDLVGHLGVLLPSGRPAVLGADTHPGAPHLYFNGFWLPASGQLPAMRRTSRRIARAISRYERSAGNPGESSQRPVIEPAPSPSSARTIQRPEGWQSG